MAKKLEKNDEYFMGLALSQAKKAAALLEVPVGAVVVLDGKVIARGHNKKESAKNAVGHAEIEAIAKACKKTHSWRLHDCALYVTLEPCAMCAGAILNARLGRVIYGAKDEKTGALGSVFDLFSYPVNHRPEITFGVRRSECEALLSGFFVKLRELKKNRKK